MNPDLQNLLYMLGGNTNQDMNYSSGQEYAQSIAGGQNVPGMIAPGVSYSAARPEGYTQADLTPAFYNPGPVPVMPSAPTQGNPLTIDNQMPYAPPGVTTPERYTPMITSAESLKNISDLFNANLPNNTQVSFDPFIPGEPMAIDDLMPSVSSSPIDFSFNPFKPNKNVDIPVDTNPKTVLEPLFKPDFVNPNPTASTGFLRVTNPDETGVAMYTNDPRKQQALQFQYDEYLNLFDTLQTRGRADYRLTSEGMEKRRQEEARFKELYNMFGVIGTGGAYTPPQEGDTRPPIEQLMANDVYGKFAIDQPAPTLPTPTEPQTTTQIFNPATNSFVTTPVPDFPSNPLNTPSTPEGEESPEQMPYAPTPGSTPYAPVEIDPTPQPIDFSFNPFVDSPNVDPVVAPELPVLTPGMTVDRTQPQQSKFAPQVPKQPSIPAAVSDFIPSLQNNPTSIQDYNDQLIKELLGPNVRSFR